MLTRSSLPRRSKPIRKSSGRLRRKAADIRYHEWVRREASCLVHVRACPLMNGGIPNTLQLHHIDFNHHDHSRVVLMCDVAHDARPLPSRDVMEAEVARLRSRYETEKGRKL